MSLAERSLLESIPVSVLVLCDTSGHGDVGIKPLIISHKAKTLTAWILSKCQRLHFVHFKYKCKTPEYSTMQTTLDINYSVGRY